MSQTANSAPDVIVPEAPSSRLRHKTTVIARNMYNITCIWTGVITPYMLNTTAWNWGYVTPSPPVWVDLTSRCRAKAGFFWAGCTALCLIWAFFRLPETKGLTFAEIDVLFAQKVSARKFTTAQADSNIHNLLQEAPALADPAVETEKM